MTDELLEEVTFGEMIETMFLDEWEKEKRDQILKDMAKIFGISEGCMMDLYYNSKEDRDE